MKREKNAEPDILFFVAAPAIPNAGEDSWYHAVRDGTALVGVFDGSGGIGGRKYENYSGKSGAYVVSRAVAGAVAEWFRAGCAAPLREYVDLALDVCKRFADPEIGLKGSMRKDFPTTLAMMTASPLDGCVDVRCWWAGDSRCYLMDGNGLHQITKDDVNTSDPMANLTDDGVLTNVVNASVPFVIREKSVKEKTPCLLISATDGCFGYLPSPMHFELMLLDALMRADSVAAWKENIDLVLRGCAGDDYSMCVAGYGFSSFGDLQGFFSGRSAWLFAELREKSRTELQTVWESYKTEYMWE